MYYSPAVPHGTAQLVENLEPRRLCADTNGFTAKIDFTPAGTAPADGYLADAGAPFGDHGHGLQYGWDADNAANFRDHGAADGDRRYDTAASMQIVGNRTWELAVPAAGDYDVRLVSGDAVYTNGHYGIDAEGVAALRGEPTEQNHFVDTTTRVSVTDGRLTLTNALRSFNNRINFIEVSSVGPPSVSAVKGPSPTIQWSDSGADAPVTRVEPGATQVGSKLFVIGGFINRDLDSTRRFDVLDLTTLQWSRLPDPPAGVPETHGAWAHDYAGNRFFIAGGQIGGSIPGVATPAVWQYDVASATWSSLPALPEARYGGGMGYLDGHLYFFGGDRPDRVTISSNLWVLDLANPQAGWVEKTPLPLGGDHIGGTVVNGQVYAVGGEHDHSALPHDDAQYIQHNYVFAYDPTADAWTRKADLPQGSSHCEATTLSVNDKIIVLGGQIAERHITDTVRLYDPATDNWTQLSPLPGRRKGGAAAYYNGALYFTNGQNDPDEGHVISRTTWVGRLG